MMASRRSNIPKNFLREIKASKSQILLDSKIRNQVCETLLEQATRKTKLFVNNLVTMATRLKTWHTTFTKENYGTFTRMKDL